VNTDAWIDMLARGAGAAPRAAALRRLAPAGMAGLYMSALLAVALLGPPPAAMFATSASWIKLGYTGALAVAAGWLAARASVPMGRTKRPQRAVLAVVLAMALLGAAVLAVGTASDERIDALMGRTWLQCPWNVLALSLPSLALTFWAMRGLAPTRPRLAGLAAGLFAGALGALGYSLSCPEASPAFVAVWYTLGVVLTGAVGMALGGRLLHW